MDSMKEALKRKYAQHKGITIDIKVHDDKNKSPDMAPSLQVDGDANPMAMHADHMKQHADTQVPPSIDGDDDDKQLEVLQSLVGTSHPGRAPNGLHERAQAGMKEKMASIIKGKKK